MLHGEKNLHPRTTSAPAVSPVDKLATPTRTTDCIYYNEATTDLSYTQRMYLGHNGRHTSILEATLTPRVWPG